MKIPLQVDGYTEVGTSLDLDKKIDVLERKRDGICSVYPKDHNIGFVDQRKK